MEAKIRCLTEEEMLQIAGGYQFNSDNEIEDVLVTGRRYPDPLPPQQFYDNYRVTTSANGSIFASFGGTSAGASKSFIDTNRDGKPDTPEEMGKAYNDYYNAHYGTPSPL